MNDILTDIVKDFSGSLGTGSHIPYYVISGSGPAYFLDPDTMEMVRVERGTEVLPIPGEDDEDGRIMVRAPFRFLMIPEDEVVDVGWN